MSELPDKIEKLEREQLEKIGDGKNFVAYSIKVDGPNNTESQVVVKLPRSYKNSINSLKKRQDTMFSRGFNSFAKTATVRNPNYLAKTYNDWFDPFIHCENLVIQEFIEGTSSSNNYMLYELATYGLFFMDPKENVMFRKLEDGREERIIIDFELVTGLHMRNLEFLFTRLNTDYTLYLKSQQSIENADPNAYVMPLLESLFARGDQWPKGTDENYWQTLYSDISIEAFILGYDLEQISTKIHTEFVLDKDNLPEFTRKAIQRQVDRFNRGEITKEFAQERIYLLASRLNPEQVDQITLNNEFFNVKMPNDYHLVFYLEDPLSSVLNEEQNNPVGTSPKYDIEF